MPTAGSEKNWSAVQSCNSTYGMRRRCEVETPTCPELGEKFVISEVKKMTVTDVIEQNIVMGSETAGASDGRADQGVM